MSRPANMATPEQMATVRRPRRAQPERILTDQIKRYAKRGGWIAYHNLHAQGSDPGFLDLTLIRPPRLVLAELKVPPNVKPSDWQEVWLAYWRALALLSGPHLSIEVFVWTPSDMEDIRRVLE